MATRGFTLTEVLVVLAIIAILMVILIPTVSSVRKSADRAQCYTNIRQLNLGARMYYQDRGEFPSWERWYFNGASTDATNRGFREYVIGDNVGSNAMKVFMSPVAAREFLPRQDVFNTYAMNYRLSNRVGHGIQSPMLIEDPSRTMHFMFGVASSPAANGYHYRPALYHLSGIYSMGNTGIDDRDRFYDDGYSTIVYYDGRVDRISREDALERTNNNTPHGIVFWRGLVVD